MSREIVAVELYYRTPDCFIILLELIEIWTQHGVTILCPQFKANSYYSRIDLEPESGSSICKAIMDGVIHNAYEILVDRKQSMQERYGLKVKKFK